MKVQLEEEKLEERRGAAGPGLIARSVDRRSLERDGATHGRVTACVTTRGRCVEGAECGRGFNKEKPARHGWGKRAGGTFKRVPRSSDRPGGARLRRGWNSADVPGQGCGARRGKAT